MVFRDVERFKVIVIQLDLRTFRDREAQTDKDFLQLVQYNIQRMLFADDNFFARQGHVDGFGRQLVRQRSLLDGFLLLVDDGFDFGAHIVDELADDRTFLRGNVFHALEERSQLTFFAEKAHTRLVKCAGVARCGKLIFCGLQNALQFFFHGDSPL